VDHPSKLTHLSLCTGYGGIDLGLSRAFSGAVRTVTYVEIEAFCIENLVAKIEGELLDVAPVFTDLKRFPWELYRGKVDLVSGGFPCQPFSSAGRRAGDDDPRHLFPHILDGLKRMGRPPLIFLENVEGIISSKLKGDGWSDPAGTSVLLHVLRELERLGYTATAGVFSAREIGAPHQRKRVFILGCRADLGASGRDLVSGLLERGGLDLVNSRDNSGLRSRAPIHSNRRTVDGRGARVPSERGTSDFDTQYASVAMWHPESRERVCSERGGNPELKRVQFQTREPSTAYPAPREQPTMGDTESEQDNLANSRKLHVSQISRARLHDASRATSGGRGAGYPAPRGRDQYDWEPPRVTREVESEMGRDIDGAPCRVDYAQLSRSVDNRTDELRMLGNGVVPDTATRAFRVLWQQLLQT
jgi:DNA (cytosine-5)-methyltransferase 1